MRTRMIKAEFLYGPLDGWQPEVPEDDDYFAYSVTSFRAGTVLLAYWEYYKMNQKTREGRVIFQFAKEVHRDYEEDQRQ